MKTSNKKEKCQARPLVAINILTWNARRYIKDCLRSALQQNYPNFQVTILDNGSKDDTVRMIKQGFKDPRIKLMTNRKNVGFAPGHNQLLRFTRGRYVVLLNQDAILTPEFVAKAVDFLEKRPGVAALQPKLLKYDFKLNKPRAIVDSAGLKMLHNRRIINRGQACKDTGQFKEGEIFGADGAVPVYRRSALEDVKVPLGAGRWEYFDEDFFAYKEDVDLAWRLRLYGWKAWYKPDIVAYHERGAGESAATSWRAILKERRSISLFAKKLSWKNQRLMQLKNEMPKLFFYNLPAIAKKELLAWGYVVLYEPKILGAVWEMVRLIPKAWKKRKFIMAHRRVGTAEMKRWL